MNDKPAITTADREIARAAWHNFCDGLKDADSLFAITEFPIDQLDLAEGIRYLSRLTRTALERCIEGANPANPYLYPLCNRSIKVGGDNPDNWYYAAAVSVDYGYLLTGDFSGCNYYSVVSTGSVDGSENVVCGALNGTDVVTDEDGLSRIQIGGNTFSGNFVKLDERTSLLIIRCTVESGKGKEPLLYLERTDQGGVEKAGSLTVNDVIKGLQNATDFVRNASSYFAQWTIDFQQHKNQLPIYPDQEYLVSIGGDPNIEYYLSVWELAVDEALVIHISDIPACVTWNLQLCNVWLESLDYESGKIHVNKSTASYNSDGSVTVAVCHSNPGRPNWLDTMGHAQGTMCLRLVGGIGPLAVSTEVVRWDTDG